MAKSSRRDLIDMSLRLWSDDVSLKDMLADVDVGITHLYVKGEPMTHKGPAAGRIAKRHYASLAQAEGTDGRDLSDWLTRTCALVAAQPGLADHIRGGRVEALFWAALLGGYSLPTPVIPTELIDEVAKLPVQILIENYLEFDDGGVPVKHFFPS